MSSFFGRFDGCRNFALCIQAFTDGYFILAYFGKVLYTEVVFNGLVTQIDFFIIKFVLLQHVGEFLLRLLNRGLFLRTNHTAVGTWCSVERVATGIIKESIQSG